MLRKHLEGTTLKQMYSMIQNSQNNIKQHILQKGKVAYDSFCKRSQPKKIGCLHTLLVKLEANTFGSERWEGEKGVQQKMQDRTHRYSISGSRCLCWIRKYGSLGNVVGAWLSLRWKILETLLLDIHLCSSHRGCICTQENITCEFPITKRSFLPMK